jgi:uncharacterized protein YjbI with pentapeptide repeats
MSYQDNTKQTSPSGKSAISLNATLAFSLLAFAVGWILFGPISGFSKFVEIGLLSLGILSLLWWSKHQQQSQLASNMSQQHYLVSLERAESAEERQTILDNMSSLGILTKTSMTGVDLSDMNLTKSNLSGTDLSLSKQKAVDLRNANLKAANLHLAHMAYANLQEANLAHANLSGATLNSCDLSGSNLQAANLSASSLIDCDLCGADLRGANLRHANLKYANLSYANLEKADLRFCILPDGSTWTSETKMRSFTHPEYQVTLADMLFAKTATQTTKVVQRLLKGTDYV